MWTIRESEEDKQSDQDSGYPPEDIDPLPAFKSEQSGIGHFDAVDGGGSSDIDKQLRHGWADDHGDR